MWENNCEKKVTLNNEDVLAGLFSCYPLLRLLVKIHVRFQSLLYRAGGNWEGVWRSGG